MAKKFKESELQNLPVCAAEFIKLVIKKMRYRKKVRQEVQAELAAHFEDELRDCTTDEEKEQRARRLIEDFGDGSCSESYCAGPRNAAELYGGP